MKLTRCRRLRTRGLTATWYRAIRPQHFQSALSYAHTATIPGRFNGGSTVRSGFRVMYLGEDQIVSLFEVTALLGSSLPGQAFVPNPASPWVIVNVNVQLTRVVDLCRTSQRRLIETTVQELTGDWRGYSLRNPNPTLAAPYWTNVPTQRLGGALHAAPDIEGFLTYSAKVPTRRNLVVFPSKLLPGSSITFVHPASGQKHSIP